MQHSRARETWVVFCISEAIFCHTIQKLTQVSIHLRFGWMLIQRWQWMPWRSYRAAPVLLRGSLFPLLQMSKASRAIAQVPRRPEEHIIPPVLKLVPVQITLFYWRTGCRSAATGSRTCCCSRSIGISWRICCHSRIRGSGVVEDLLSDICLHKHRSSAAVCHPLPRGHVVNRITSHNAVVTAWGRQGRWWWIQLWGLILRLATRWWWLTTSCIHASFGWGSITCSSHWDGLPLLL